jgi:hypothetical protein
LAIARGVAIAGAEANRIALIALVTFALTSDRHGKAAPTLGASADLALIARTGGQSRWESLLPVIGEQSLGNPCRPIDRAEPTLSGKRSGECQPFVGKPRFRPP